MRAARATLVRAVSRTTPLPTLNYTRRGFSLRPDDTGRVRLCLPGGVTVPVVWSRELPSEPTSARVHRDSLGHWYVSFVVEAFTEPLPVPDGAGPLGIDWGVTATATTTDAEFDLEHHQRAKAAARRLAHYQRRMARRRPPRGKPASKGYQRAKTDVARAHKKVARQRADDHRKWAKKAVRAHDQIACEDFRPKFLASTPMAAKSADAGLASAKAALVAMAAKHERDLRLVPPAHTTTDCSSCGARAKRLPLSERTYRCNTCGLVCDRDRNPAAVMVARAGFVPAGADGTRPGEPPGSQAG